MTSRVRFLFCLLLMTPTVWAEIEIAPTHLSLGDKKRVAALQVWQHGPTPVTIKVATVFEKMDANGNFTEAKELKAEDRALSGVRVSPSTLTLLPDEPQEIGVSVSALHLPPGEYRTALRFEPQEAAAPAPTPPPDPRPLASLAPGASAASATPPSPTPTPPPATPLSAVTIPLVFSHGKVVEKISLENLHLESADTPTPVLVMNVHNAGNGFGLGDLTALFDSSHGETVPVGLLRGIGCFVDKRELRVPLSVPPRGRLEHGKLRVELRPPPDPETKKTNAVLATAQLQVP